MCAKKKKINPNKKQTNKIIEENGSSISSSLERSMTDFQEGSVFHSQGEQEGSKMKDVWNMSRPNASKGRRFPFASF